MSSLLPDPIPSIAEDCRISFEFFPPKTEKMETQLWDTVETLAPLKPSFVSVTYGAGGSTRERTHRLVRKMITDKGLTAAAHLTCVGASRRDIDDVVDGYHAAGVRHIVALRGDPPEGEADYTPHAGGYRNAADLVAGIRSRYDDMEISVAAYPERHPMSPSLVADLDNLKAKIDAGANRAITQFFFNVDDYFRFRDHCDSYGIHVPIVPGILPVSNFASLKRFAALSGATVPTWLGHLFEGLDARPSTRQLIAASVAIRQVEALYADGVRDFHFYTLNRAELSYAICHMLGRRPEESSHD